MSGMPRRRAVVVAGWVGAALVLAVGLAGCSRSAQNGDPTKLHQQAEAALTRWDQAVAAAGGTSAFVAVGELTGMIGGDWGPVLADSGKLALMAGDFEAVGSLPSDPPPDGKVQWPDGSTRTVGLISAQQALADVKADSAGSCKECVPLKVTSAQLTTGNVQTEHGLAVAPVWEFRLQDTDVRISRVAVAHLVKVVPPPYDPNDAPQGISIDLATGTAAGRELTVSFTGASTDSGSCGSDYTAEAVESSTAIVAIVTEHPHAGLPGACDDVGYIRTATVELSAPLGNRAVLEVTQGLPVSVTLTP
jgi:hypothetical protein